MPFRNIINPDQIALLTQVLDAHCNKFGIHSEEAKLSAAASLITLFQGGVTDPRELAQRLEIEDRPDQLRTG